MKIVSIVLQQNHHRGGSDGSVGALVSTDPSSDTNVSNYYSWIDQPPSTPAFIFDWIIYTPADASWVRRLKIPTIWGTEDHYHGNIPEFISPAKPRLGHFYKKYNQHFNLRNLLRICSMCLDFCLDFLTFDGSVNNVSHFWKSDKNWKTCLALNASILFYLPSVRMFK